MRSRRRTALERALRAALRRERRLAVTGPCEAWLLARCWTDDLRDCLAYERGLRRDA